MNKEKTTLILLLAGLAVCLIQVWLPAYYVTGDGPCHVYNAQILHDLWNNKNVAFYKSFYTPFYQPNPNWLSTLIMAVLMFLVNGIIAEKIFLSIYIVLYISGFYLLLRRLCGTNTLWPLAILIFVFPHTLSKGFYNYSFSIAFYFWVVWSWIRVLNRRTITNCMLFFVFTGLLFFTHLLAFGFGVITCASLILSYYLSMAPELRRQQFKSFFLGNTISFIFLLLQYLLVMIWFTGKEGGLQLHLQHHFYRLIELVQFKYIVNVTHQEDKFALIAGITLLLLMLLSFIRYKTARRVGKYDGFLLSLFIVTFIYLFFPEDFLGRLIIISMRAQLFVFILIVCCVSYMLPYLKLKNAGGLVLFSCFAGLSIYRIPCQLRAADGAADLLSATSLIRPNSVLLPLSFSLNGIDQHHRIISDKNWLFCHPADYAGINKPLIILDNYEANMGYFPINWLENVNPYTYLSNYSGIEGQPPNADIDRYRQTTGTTIDYILMWCYDSSALSDAHFKELYGQINLQYKLLYTSASGRSMLYERKE